MGKLKPLYTYAVREKGEKAYKIVSNAAGIPVQKTIENAEQDYEVFASDKKMDKLEPVIIDISGLVEEGIILGHRLFGKGIR